MQIVAGTTTLIVKPGDAAAGDLSGTFAAPVVDGIQNVPVLATAPVLNQVLKFNGTAWAPANEGMPGDASYAAKGAVQFLTDQATSGIQVAAGVVSLPNLITAGGPTGSAQIIPVITYDAKGRLTAVSTATVNDNTKLPLDGSVPMTGSLNMGNQNITNVNSVSSTSLGSRSLRLFDADNSNYVDLQTPSVVATNYVLTLPVDDGTAGQVLTTDGNGVLSWGAAGSGISVTANQAVISNGAGNGLVNFSCPLNQVFSFDGMGTPTCQAVTPAGGFINNGNSFAGNSTLGLNDSFDLNFETAGTTRMTLTAAGNVGIGVTNPSYLLQVSSSDETGAVEFRNNINPRGIAPVLTLSGSYSGGGGATGDGAGLVFKGETTSGTVHELGSLQMVLTDGTHSTRSGAMLFNTVNNASAASERMRITSAGNVGIGTTTPTQLLHVNGPMRLTASALPGTPAAGDIAVDSGDANKLKYYDGSAWQTAGGTSGSLPAAGGTAAAPGYAFSGDTNTGVFSSVADTIQFSTNSIERMRITSAGNVGIGTTNPGYLFDISNNAFNRFYVDQMGPGYTTVHAYGEGFGQFLASDKSDLSSHSFMFDGGGGGQSLWGTTRGTMNFIIGGNIYTAVDLTFSSDGTINTNGNIKSNAAAVPGIYGTGAFVAATSTANSGAGFYASANNSGTSWGGFGVGYGATPKWTFGISRNIADTTALIFTEDGNAANTRMTIGTGGNVGIGTSSPSARLDVRGTWPNHLLLGDAGNAGGLGFRRGSEGNVNAGIGLDSALGQDIEIWNSSGSGSVAHKLGAFYPLRTYLTDVNTNTTTELNSVLRINPPQVVPGVSGGGWSRIYFDAASGKLKVSENGGAYVDLVGGGSISGSGTTGRLPKFTSSSALGDSIMTDNGTNIEISSGIARLRLTPDAVGGHSEVRSTSGSSLNLVGGNGASQITVGWNGAITANTGASGNAFQVINSSDNIFRINSGDAAVWDFRANYASNNNLTLTPSVGGGNFIVSGANVGIGTTNPTAKLQVEGAIVSKPQAIASGGAVNLALSNTHTLSNIG
ncbi:MAG: beta strand repeat-containing protein, partial [Bdellovibrionales bacterium]